MLNGNDNHIYPEYKPLADDLIAALLQDKLPFVWDTYLIGVNWQLRCSLSSPFSSDSDKAFSVAHHLELLARYCNIDIYARAPELTAILPGLATWLSETRLLPLHPLNPALPVFRPPTDISRL